MFEGWLEYLDSIGDYSLDSVIQYADLTADVHNVPAAYLLDSLHVRARGIRHNEFAEDRFILPFVDEMGRAEATMKDNCARPPPPNYIRIRQREEM